MMFKYSIIHIEIVFVQNGLLFLVFIMKILKLNCDSFLLLSYTTITAKSFNVKNSNFYNTNGNGTESPLIYTEHALKTILKRTTNKYQL